MDVLMSWQSWHIPMSFYPQNPGWIKPPIALPRSGAVHGPMWPATWRWPLRWVVWEAALMSRAADTSPVEKTQDQPKPLKSFKAFGFSTRHTKVLSCWGYRLILNISLFEMRLLNFFGFSAEFLPGQAFSVSIFDPDPHGYEIPINSSYLGGW